MMEDRACLISATPDSSNERLFNLPWERQETGKSESISGAFLDFPDPSRENAPGDATLDAYRSQRVHPSSMGKRKLMDISPEMKRRLLMAIF
jgi:hypothetical protein